MYQRMMRQINHYINSLYFSPCVYTRNIVLNQLRNRMQLLNNYILQQNNITLVAENINQRTFTIEELAKFNGKDGNRAYIAVNGVVYDVTDNAAWAAATHFGLSAGKDLTNEFASCHRGQQQILNMLNVVGRLI